MDMQVYPDREMLFLSLANRLAGQLADFLRREGRASFAVPGGTSPGPVFDMLNDVDMDWAQVTVMPTDERWVPGDSPRSNTRLLRERLLVDRAAAANLLPLHAPVERPEDALDTLSLAIRPHLPVSVLLLGMGADMHIASLFPGAEGLAEALSPQAPPVVALRGGGAEEARVSLTAPVLTGAIQIHLLITGAEKRAALERAAGLPVEQAPVRLVLDRATVHWAE